MANHQPHGSMVGILSSFVAPNLPSYVLYISPPGLALKGGTTRQKGTGSWGKVGNSEAMSSPERGCKKKKKNTPEANHAITIYARQYHTLELLIVCCILHHRIAPPTLTCMTNRHTSGTIYGKVEWDHSVERLVCGVKPHFQT